LQYLIVGITNVFIMKNTGYEIIEKDRKEIFLKTIEDKYFLYKWIQEKTAKIYLIK
jgi:hypothetical protein